MHFFTGCTAKQSTPEQMKSTLAVADKLGIELVELTEDFMLWSFSLTRL